MQQVTVDAARWQQDSEGAWLALRVKSPQAAMEVCDALKPGKEYTATIKGKGRSLDANAYCWELLDKLAAHYTRTATRCAVFGGTVSSRQWMNKAGRRRTSAASSEKAIYERR